MSKKDSRILLRVTEEMRRDVICMAQLHQRSIQDETRFLIGEGLELHRPVVGKEISVPKRQLLSTRPSSLVNSRKQEKAS